MILVAMVFALTSNAQSESAVKSSTFFDNMYVGVYGGASVKTTHVSWFDNLNTVGGVRIGKNVTPILGFAIDGIAYFDNNPKVNSGTFIQATNVSLLSTINFMNMFGGYTGTPRTFEISGIAGIGWGHVFGAIETLPKVLPTDYADGIKLNDCHRNVFTSKFGLDFGLNVGKSKAWQVYAEPAITYGMNVNGSDVQYNVNNSAFSLTAGVIYKFKNSHGTHNFVLAKLLDEEQWNRMNDDINNLRSENGSLTNTVNEQAKAIQTLTDELNKMKSGEKLSIGNVVNFKINSAKIDALQMGNLEKVAEVLKQNPDKKITVRGMADAKTGTAEFNQKLSEKRANAVKNALVKLGVPTEQISTEGVGSTQKEFAENDWNRVALFVTK